MKDEIMESIITDLVTLHSIIRELHERLKEKEWICVKERLPKDEHEFILCVYAINIWPIGYGTSDKGIYTSVYYYPKINKWGQWVHGNFVHVGGEVTHWKSWPEPPK